MLGYLPKPYPDELLYSVAARYRIHFKLSGFAVTNLFFGGNSRAIVDLPHSIGYFSKASFALWGMSPEDIVNKFTLFPFYARFVDNFRYAKAERALISNNGQIVHPMLALSASSIKVPKFLRFCPVCVSKDLDTYGETYWHRTHQLPGVLACVHHGTMLINSTASYRPKIAYDYADASETIEKHKEESTNALSALDLEKCTTIAAHCEMFLNARDTAQNSIVNSYKQVAINSGFVFGDTNVSNEKLERAFISFYGESLLELLGASINSCNRGNWLRKFFRESSHGYHPTQHALVSIFLQSASQIPKLSAHFGNGPWKCPNPYANHTEQRPIHNIKIRIRNGIPVASVKCSCGFNFSFRNISSTDPSLPIVHTTCGTGPTWIAKVKELEDSGLSCNAIAKKLGVDFKTVRALLSCGQGKISDLISDSSSEQSNQFSLPPIVFNETTAIKRSLVKPPRVVSSRNETNDKWTRKDEVLEQIIRSTNSYCYDEFPPKQVTKARLMSAANIGFSMYSTLEKLPLCQKAFDELAESLEDFRERRLRCVAERAQMDGLLITRRSLLRLASLEPRAMKPVSARVESVLSELLGSAVPY